MEEASPLRSRHRPEPPRLLARGSRLEAQEIKLMYRGFKQECPSGLVDEESFTNIFSQFFPLGDATQYAQLVFNSIKHKESGKVNFEQLVALVSRVGRGSLQERVSWVFALYDADGDGRISRAELLRVVRAVHRLLGPAAAAEAEADTQADRIFHAMDANSDGVVTPDELARWCERDPDTLRSLDALDTTL